ncbi:MAG: universal stress protein [Dehalococcoidia bacterium]
MFERVILADDGSPLARTAIPRTAALSAACGAEVLVVRVSHAAGVRPQDLDEDEWRRYVSPEGVAAAVVSPVEAEPRLSEVVAELQSRGVEGVGSIVLHADDAGDALVEAADELEADLLVLSSRGQGGVRRYVLGSVAEQLTREARETAILLCPAPTEAPEPGSAPEGALRRLLLPLDGSEVSEVAIAPAAELARALGAELVLLRATDAEADLLAASMPTGVPPTATISTDDARRIAAEERELAGESLRDHAARLREQGLTALGVEVVAGDPAAAILEAVERLDVDLVVMATHGRGGLGRLLLGSVADRVTRESERAAVLLVRPSED